MYIGDYESNFTHWDCMEEIRKKMAWAIKSKIRKGKEKTSQ